MKRLLQVSMVLLSLLIITACGSKNSDNTSSVASNNTDSAGPIIIKHGKGETKLDKPAVRVVALEWIYTEELIALGIQPVGNADNKEYEIWVTDEAALADSVTDVGLRWEPNLETIASLKPDLIISNTDNNDAIYNQLNAIAPTIEFDPYPNEGDAYTGMVNDFKTIAKAVGKSKEADKVLADLDTHYAAAKEKLKAAGKDKFNYVITQAFSSQNAATLRMFTETSTVVQTLNRIGLTSDWKSDKFEKYGFTDATFESLPAVSDSNFIYIVQKDDNVFGDSVKNNKVWNGLNFVKENRTYGIGGDTWTFGGPLSSKVLVDRVVEAITK
ncbi:ABC transporter substrate-binding protein [Brevibacillus brevis]|uniref:ABC transporter substrate-binding protein n=1 Tax=Brevibacillus brevis TaxID=1393 RepID=UPI000D102B03|nr:iron-siderophore ABC transporter substrate-binding protein [Brevibacillus brevis]PSJ63531.1 Fe3+-citrate ABC transporter substrate-binding protein [Brevibacillus brevis]RED33864.1 iron complex transport system substrate-binding protein [Brevibacillus brevis]GEC89374.1 ferrichrome ABC transporter substrate-binding protein [Brevibacillus brevis]VEF92566.1 Putative ABC transporter substrate-binding lipoprotein yhfQ precursor [Brevibacillus brevis]